MTENRSLRQAYTEIGKSLQSKEGRICNTFPQLIRVQTSYFSCVAGTGFSVIVLEGIRPRQWRRISGELSSFGDNAW